MVGRGQAGTPEPPLGRFQGGEKKRKSDAETGAWGLDRGGSAGATRTEDRKGRALEADTPPCGLTRRGPGSGDQCKDADGDRARGRGRKVRPKKGKGPKNPLRGRGRPGGGEKRVRMGREKGEGPRKVMPGGKARKAAWGRSAGTEKKYYCVEAAFICLRERGEQGTSSVLE